MSKLRAVMDELGEDLVKEIVKELIRADKKASGELIRSIEYRLVQAADSFIVELLAAPYFEYVDQGVNGTERNRGSKYSFMKKTVNLKAIDKWIVRRGIAPRDKKGQFIPRKSVKFLIGRSIARKGIKGIHILEDSINKIYSLKEELIIKAGKQDLEAIIDKIIIK